MWSYLGSPTALLARELGAVPKFPPQHPRRVMLPVPKKLALAAWGKDGANKRKASDDSAACTCKRARWTDALTDLASEEARVPPPAPASVCSANAHRPENKQKREYKLYWLFEAAYAGCLPCVSRFLEQEGVDPAVLSLSQGYSALDFALWGLSQGSPQAGAVASYLLAHYPHMPRHDRGGLGARAEPHRW